MSASLYIVVEGEDPGFDIFVNGHAMARNEDALERLAERLSVPPLLEFFSADRNSMALLLDQGAGDPEWTHHLPQPQWFPPEDGLRTIRSLLDFLAMAPAARRQSRSPQPEPCCCSASRASVTQVFGAARELIMTNDTGGLPDKVFRRAA